MFNLRIFSLLLLTVSLFFNSCTIKEPIIPLYPVQVTLHTPEGLEDLSLSNVTLTFREINAGISRIISLDQTGTLSQPLPVGSYSVLLAGDISYKKDQQTVKSKVRASKKDIIVRDNKTAFELDLFLADDHAGFIFKEIFFTGTLTPEGKSYNGDKYFIIYNNSADTLYADGLVIAQSAFLSNSKREYTPDVMAEAFTSNSIIMVPGSGQEYPVLPGNQIVIANNAIDHIEYNANSMDLTTADFEIELLGTINVDNPEVTNMTTISGSMLMNNRGFSSYVLARLPAGMTVDDYKLQNLYTYSYFLTPTAERTANAFKIPNDYVIDAVNLSVEEVFQWTLMAPQLDLGWTYCGKTSSDATRYGKSVLRKQLTTNPDGRIIYQDSNNSTVDFIPEAKPSLIP